MDTRRVFAPARIAGLTGSRDAADRGKVSSFDQVCSADAARPSSRAGNRRTGAPDRGAVNRSADDEKAEHREERQDVAAPIGDPKSEHISIVGLALGRDTDLQIRPEQNRIHRRCVWPTRQPEGGHAGESANVRAVRSGQRYPDPLLA
jgi:hypothetical protein